MSSAAIPVDDGTIEDAIAQHDDPEHEDALTVDELRDVLVEIQTSAGGHWGEWADTIERGDATVVAETDGLVVLDTGNTNAVAQELGHLSVTDEEGIRQRVVTAIMHDLAREHADHDWSATYPFVVRKPEGFGAGQAYVEAVVNGLQQRGLSPGQAWAYYGVEIRGNSMNAWGARKGDHDHKNVSDALQKARSKLA